MFDKHNTEREALILKCKSIFHLVISLLILLSFLAGPTANAVEPDPLPQSFGFRLDGSEGDNQSLIDRLSKQLSSEPYRADLYYHLARAYDKQGWQDKAAQYMNQWVKTSNNDIVMNESHIFTLDEKNDKVLMIDKNTKEVVRKIDVGWFPKKIIPTPDGTRLYVTNALADSVSSISTDKMAVTSTIKSGKMPWNGKSSPQGDRVYVGNLKSDSVSVIDTGSDSILETVKVGHGPWGIAVSPDGHRLYVSNQDSRDIQIIDTGSFSVVDVITIGNHPRDIALAPDDPSKLYAIDGDIITDEVEIYVVDLDDARIVKALNIQGTDDPLLARFEEMSFKDKLALIGNFVKPDKEEAKGPIRKPEIANPPLFAIAPDSSSSSLRPVVTRDTESEQMELPMGGPAPLMEPLMEAYVKIPTKTPLDSTIKPVPQEMEPTTESEPITPQEVPEPQPRKRILRIIVVVKHDTLWDISIDNYGEANNRVYKEIQKENPAIVDVNKIYVGQKIKLPVIHTDVEEIYAGKTVVVKRNDNLYRIAMSNYGIVNQRIYDAILKANPRIKNVSHIMVGQRILLPTL